MKSAGLKANILNAPRVASSLRDLMGWNGPVVTLLGLTVAILSACTVMALPAHQGATVVALVAVIVGTLIEPFVGVGAALFVGPLKSYLSSEVPQIPAQIGHVFVILALGSWLMGQLAERDVRIDRVKSPLFLPLVAFMGAALLSLWDAVGLATYGVPELVKWLEIVLLFIMVKEHLATASAAGHEGGTRRLQVLVAMLIGSGLLQALIGIWQFALRGEGPDHFQILGGEFFRAYGTFEQPNPYAGYLGFTAALAIGVVLTVVWEWFPNGFAGRAHGRIRVLASSLRSSDRPSLNWLLFVFSAGAALAMVVALVASWSRGGWLGFGAAMLAVAVALPRRAVWGLLLATVLIAGALLLQASGRLPASFAERLTTFVGDLRLEDVRGAAIDDANYAVIERLAHWQTALDMFRHDIWFGVGFGCYEAVYPALALINWPIALGHAHNIYLNLAAETGLIGLGTYLLFWGVVFWQTWQVTRRARGLTRGLAIGLLGAWTQISVHHLLDYLYVNNAHLHIAVLLGMAAFIIQQTSREASIYDL